MSKVKEKLISAIVDISLSDIGESALVDILVAKIKSLEAEVSNLEGANAHERLMLESQREKLHRQIKEVRTNPMYGAHGQYYFLGPNGEKVDLYMLSGSVKSACIYKKTARYQLEQVSYEKFKRVA